MSFESSCPRIGFPAVPDGSPSSLERNASPRGPQPPGVAVVRGVVIPFAQRVEPFADLLLRTYGIDPGEELAAPLPAGGFGGGRDGPVTVAGHVYRTFLKSRSQRMFAGKLFSASSDSHTNDALPTMWSSGTKPQKRESAELWRLSPIIQ